MLDRFHLRLEQQTGPHPLEAPGELRRQLGVEKGQEPRSAIDQGHLHAEVGEDRCVLAADGTAADHHQGLGQPIDGDDALRIVHVDAVEVDVRRMMRPRSGREQYHPTLQDPLLPLLGPDDHRPRRGQARVSLDDFDVVSLQVLADRIGHCGDHVVDAGAEPVHHEVGSETDADPVDVSPRPARQVDRGVPQRLDGDAGGRDRRPSGQGTALDHCDAVTEVGGLGRPLLPCRT